MTNQFKVLSSEVLTRQTAIADAEAADSIFDMLMGDDVAPRREFIEENAVFVENLDI